MFDNEISDLIYAKDILYIRNMNQSLLENNYLQITACEKLVLLIISVKCFISH